MAIQCCHLPSVTQQVEEAVELFEGALNALEDPVIIQDTTPGAVLCHLLSQAVTLHCQLQTDNQQHLRTTADSSNLNQHLLTVPKYA